MFKTENIVCLFLISVSTALFADNNIKYEKIFFSLYSEYQIAYNELNLKIGNCSLQKKSDYDFPEMARKIPQHLSKTQLNSALFLLKKRYEDKCIHSELATYLIKSNYLKKLISIIQSQKIVLPSDTDIDSIVKQIDEMEELLFYTPATFFALLSDYETINLEDRKALESIKELQSSYNLVLLLDSIKKYQDQKDGF